MVQRENTTFLSPVDVGQRRADFQTEKNSEGPQESGEQNDWEAAGYDSYEQMVQANAIMQEMRELQGKDEARRLELKKKLFEEVFKEPIPVSDGGKGVEKIMDDLQVNERNEQAKKGLQRPEGYESPKDSGIEQAISGAETKKGLQIASSVGRLKDIESRLSEINDEMPVLEGNSRLRAEAEVSKLRAEAEYRKKKIAEWRKQILEIMDDAGETAIERKARDKFIRDEAYTVTKTFQDVNRESTTAPSGVDADSTTMKYEVSRGIDIRDDVGKETIGFDAFDDASDNTFAVEDLSSYEDDENDDEAMAELANQIAERNAKLKAETVEKQEVQETVKEIEVVIPTTNDLSRRLERLKKSSRERVERARERMDLNEYYLNQLQGLEALDGRLYYDAAESLLIDIAGKRAQNPDSITIEVLDREIRRAIQERLDVEDAKNEQAESESSVELKVGDQIEIGMIDGFADKIIASLPAGNPQKERWKQIQEKAARRFGVLPLRVIKNEGGKVQLIDPEEADRGRNRELGVNNFVVELNATQVAQARANADAAKKRISGSTYTSRNGDPLKSA